MGKKKRIGLIVMVCTLFGLFGIFVAFQNKTLAFFTDTDSAKNTVITGKLVIDTNEEIASGIKHNVGAENTSNVAVYVRMMVLIPDNKYLGFETVYHTDEEDKSKPKDWSYNESDNYWYYDLKLLPGETALLYESIKAMPKDGVTATPELLNQYGDVIVYVEAVQADNITLPEGEHPALAAFAQLK